MRSDGTSFCRKHPDVAMQNVCDVMSCGACFGEALETEPYRPAKAQTRVRAMRDEVGHLEWVIGEGEPRPGLKPF
jgi:hypothetical protein